MAQQCTLVSDWFGWLVQILLGAAALLALAYKRYHERPQRPWKVFFRDVAKQVVAAGLAHILNVVLSLMLRQYGNECKWYFVNYIVDSVIGTMLNLGLLYVVVTVGGRYTHALTPGHYYHPDVEDSSPGRVWLLQLVVWCSIVIVVKVILFFAFLLPLRDPLYKGGDAVISPFDRWPKLELVFVMIIVPGILNILQFWVQDTWLKHERDYHAADEHVADDDRICGGTSSARTARKEKKIAEERAARSSDGASDAGDSDAPTMRAREPAIDHPELEGNDVDVVIEHEDVHAPLVQRR